MIDITNKMLEEFKITGEVSPRGEKARQAFAASLQLPLNRMIETGNIARTMFMVDKLGPGDEPIYPMDLEPIDAVVLPRIGQPPQHLVGQEELHVLTFEVTTSMEWPLRMARLGRLNIVQRKTRAVKDAIVRMENAAAWSVVQAAVLSTRTVSSQETSFSKKACNEGFQMMESLNGYHVDLIVVNAKRAGDVRGWDSAALDPVTMREVWRNAGVGNVWGADILIDNSLPDNKLYFFDTSRMGIMPIRQEFTTYDDPSAINLFRQRILGYEEIGFACVDANAIVMVQLSS